MIYSKFDEAKGPEKDYYKGMSVDTRKALSNLTPGNRKSLVEFDEELLKLLMAQYSAKDDLNICIRSLKNVMFGYKVRVSMPEFVSTLVDLDSVDESDLPSIFQKHDEVKNYLYLRKKYDEARKVFNNTKERVEHHESMYKGHSRYYYVSEGHLHLNPNCSTLNKGITPTTIVLLPILSGMPRDEVLSIYGDTTCDMCLSKK